MSDLPPSERIRRALRALFDKAYEGEPWAKWLLDLFPEYFVLADGTVSFADFHRELWAWVFGIDETRPRPFLAVWPRDTGKSTHAEVACAYLGVTDKRRYALYVCGTQDRADDHVNNIAALLESPAIAQRYPEHSERAVSKFNQSKGWRVSRVRTAGGFTVDAIGLDKAVRGARLEMERPDLIILDDIDGRHDSPRAAKKKIEQLTDNIIPAGNRDRVAILFAQNIIHDNSVMAQLVDGKASFLQNRIVSGPHPAIRNFTYEEDEGRTVVTGGDPTWDGLSLATCQRIIDDIGISAFLREYQQKRSEGKGALWSEALIEQRRVDSIPEDLSHVVVAVDPQASNQKQGSETGIVVVGLSQGKAYVLRDASGFYSPDEWAQESLQQYDAWKADVIVGERNNGGDMVEANIIHARPNASYDAVWASRGKYTRAEPVVALYERGMVYHAGRFPMLEGQMTTPYDPFDEESSWDRMDALVWAVTHLLLSVQDAPHFDRQRHTYTPAATATKAYIIDPKRVYAWKQAIEQGRRVPAYGPEDYEPLRRVFVAYLEEYQRTKDYRGALVVEQYEALREKMGDIKV